MKLSGYVHISVFASFPQWLSNAHVSILRIINCVVNAFRMLCFRHPLQKERPSFQKFFKLWRAFSKTPPFLIVLVWTVGKNAEKNLYAFANKNESVRMVRMADRRKS